MSKTILAILGVVIILMGVAALIPGWTIATEPVWHAIVKIVVGIIAVAVAAGDKK